jgi:hypothetical protein
MEKGKFFEEDFEKGKENNSIFVWEVKVFLLFFMLSY